jgi:hypothetical protein
VLKKKLPTLIRSVGAEGVIIADKSLKRNVNYCGPMFGIQYKVFIVPVITVGKSKGNFSKVRT